MGISLYKGIKDIFRPIGAKIKDITIENPAINTYSINILSKSNAEDFSFAPGQFVMLSIPHMGEAPISISSSPTIKGRIDLSVRKAGALTSALHNMKAGDYVAIRGPYGRPFPMDKIEGKELIFIAGGIGLAPLKSVIDYCIEKGSYQKMTILYGSKSPQEIAFKKAIDKWRQEMAIDIRLTVDAADRGWKGNVGLVTALLDNINIEEGTICLLCGPPVMIDITSELLLSKGVAPENIITTLERNMQCGIGLCGHCFMEDGRLVCRHGPVFTLKELKEPGSMLML